MNQSLELKSDLQLFYATVAQYNNPPIYPVTKICGAIDGGASFGSDILSRIYAGVVAFKGNSTCKVNGPIIDFESDQGWKWQVILFTNIVETKSHIK